MSERQRRPALFPLRGLSDSERELLYDNAPSKPSVVSLTAVATASVFLERDKLNDERKDLNTSSVAKFQTLKTALSTMGTSATAASSSFRDADGGVDSLRERFLDAVNLDERVDGPLRNPAGNWQMGSSPMGENAIGHNGHQEQASSAYPMPSQHIQYVARGGGLAGRPPISSHRGGKVTNNARLFH
ncbi:hypothetical protein AAVH_01016 [Aphelenchoides avenae]|nr:hypothetical protein AAVH_01016 [Aphelenchus avenae]